MINAYSWVGVWCTFIGQLEAAVCFSQITMNLGSQSRKCVHKQRSCQEPACSPQQGLSCVPQCLQDLGCGMQQAGRGRAPGSAPGRRHHQFGLDNFGCFAADIICRGCSLCALQMSGDRVVPPAVCWQPLCQSVGRGHKEGLGYGPVHMAPH